MITLCWAAKGGSGTTVVAASLALAQSRRTLLVDLSGDVPSVLGLHDGDRPGVLDWLRSTAPTTRLGALELAAGPACTVLPAGAAGAVASARWSELAQWLRVSGRTVVIDAGTGTPPSDLVEAVDQRWLVTRACYLALRAATRQTVRPSGIVLVNEPGRALRRADVESALGTPIVAELDVEPAIARAVDAGLLASRVPTGLRRALEVAA